MDTNLIEPHNSFVIRGKKINDFTLEKINSDEYQLSHGFENLFYHLEKILSILFNVKKACFTQVIVKLRQSFRKFLLFR